MKLINELRKWSPTTKELSPSLLPFNLQRDLVISFLISLPLVYVEDKPIKGDNSTCASDHKISHLFPNYPYYNF